MSRRSLLAPETRGSAPASRSIVPVVSADRHSAGIWVGAFRNSLRSVGCGSAPSDPRRTYYIGNQGNRKPEKIRKIGKVSFNQTILIHSELRAQSSGEPLIDRRGRADRAATERHRRRRPRHGLCGRFPPAAPFRSAGFMRKLRRGTRLPLSYFDPRPAATLESFSDCSEQTDLNDRRGRAGAGLIKIVRHDSSQRKSLHDYRVLIYSTTYKGWDCKGEL